MIVVLGYNLGLFTLIAVAIYFTGSLVPLFGLVAVMSYSTSKDGEKD